MLQNTMIHAEGLTKLYGNKVVVEDVSFDVGSGAVAGLLGPNGAGKSTIMKLLTGFIVPDSGEISIDGIDVLRNYRAAAVKIGYAPEIPPIFPDMTVEAYLFFVADIKGVRKSERASHVQVIMEMARVADVRGRLLKNLSKGYRQRVGIAQALVSFPPVLILDEPAAGLDPAQIHQLRELLRSLAGKHTIILSSHILSEISILCDEVIIINNGRVAARERIDNAADGDTTFLLSLKTSDRDRALACVGSVSGIVNAMPAGSMDNGLIIRLQLDPGLDNAVETREALFRALSAAQLPILELVRKRKNLEDIYMRATLGNMP